MLENKKNFFDGNAMGVLATLQSEQSPTSLAIKPRGQR